MGTDNSNSGELKLGQEHGSMVSQEQIDTTDAETRSPLEERLHETDGPSMAVDRRPSLAEPAMINYVYGKE